MFSTSGGITSSHYEAHSKADSYENAYFTEPGRYMEHLATLAYDKLHLPLAAEEDEDNEVGSRDCRCILDIGGGTGNFARALLAKQVTRGGRNDSAFAKIVVVDPFLCPKITNESTESNDNSNGNSGSDDLKNISDNLDLLSFVKAPAEDFLQPPSSSNEDCCWRTNTIDREFGGYDQILLKEVVHHFEKKDRVGIFRGMREGLRRRSSSFQKQTTPTTLPPPSLLIITRPNVNIDYPLWDQARAVWKEDQPSIEEIEDELKQAGYTRLERSMEAYPCSISLPRWQAMVKNRFWSTFSKFSDEELEQACKSIAQDYDAKKTPETAEEDNYHDPILQFEDRLIFLTAS